MSLHRTADRSGLQAMAREKIIHRDIKPHNVMINSKGIAKIADFDRVGYGARQPIDLRRFRPWKSGIRLNRADHRKAGSTLRHLLTRLYP